MTFSKPINTLLIIIVLAVIHQFSALTPYLSHAAYDAINQQHRMITRLAAVQSTFTDFAFE